MIKIEAIYDPMFNGIDSFKSYELITSEGCLVEHLILVLQHVLKDKPKGNPELMIYSMPDRLGMRFLRHRLIGDSNRYTNLSDFRHEWVFDEH